ncbi:hypothetical protein [Cohnella sp. GCM10012308]|uniref:hypothetical protein n=1 Tax=Cohnella sp. GCM10012308 TaxID=3317329 RepID=UPI00362403D1
MALIRVLPGLSGNPEKQIVGSIYYVPEGLSDELKAGTIEVFIPVPEANGKMPTMFYNSVKKSVFYEYTDVPVPLEGQVDQLKAVIPSQERRIADLELALADLFTL